MRAKFRVDTVTHSVDSVSATLSPVIGNTEENKSFWKYTPSGTIQMTYFNPSVQDFFQPGKEFYVDFTLA